MKTDDRIENPLTQEEKSIVPPDHSAKSFRLLSKKSGSKNSYPDYDSLGDQESGTEEVLTLLSPNLDYV